MYSTRPKTGKLEGAEVLLERSLHDAYKGHFVALERKLLVYIRKDCGTVDAVRHPVIAIVMRIGPIRPAFTIGDERPAAAKGNFKHRADECAPIVGVGVPGAAAPVFDLHRDPREMFPHVGAALWSGASFQDMIKRHQLTIAKYPHFKLGKGRPYDGIENLRPESKQTVESIMSWQPKNN